MSPTTRKPISCIVACCPDGGIGYRGTLPWPRIREDRVHFKRTTVDVDGGVGMRNAVIMGRNTWDET